MWPFFYALLLLTTGVEAYLGWLTPDPSDDLAAIQSDRLPGTRWRATCEARRRVAITETQGRAAPIRADWRAPIFVDSPARPPHSRLLMAIRC